MPATIDRKDKKNKNTTVLLSFKDRKYTIVLECNNSTVNDLLRKIDSVVSNFDIKDVQLIYSGRNLVNKQACLIKDYGFQSHGVIEATPRLLGGKIGTSATTGIDVFGIPIPTDPVQIALWAVIIAAGIFLLLQVMVYIMKFLNWLWDYVIGPPVNFLIRWLLKPLYKMLRSCCGCCTDTIYDQERRCTEWCSGWRRMKVV